MTESSPFWHPIYFDLADWLNHQIWRDSQNVQRRLQRPDTLWKQGCVGAQQSMHDPGIYRTVNLDTMLRWVPDLVGRDWRSETAIFIVGSAYAPFIREYTKIGRGLLPLREYAEASNSAQFTAAFLRFVAAHHDHYEWVRNVAKSHLGVMSPRSITVLDVCRVSFVMRGRDAGDLGVREDIGGDHIVEKEGPKFTLYAAARSWLFRRFAGGEARRIVTLGRIAELGVLRAFVEATQIQSAPDALFSLRIIQPDGNPWQPKPKHLRDDWTRRGVFADPSGANYWGRGFWKISGVFDGQSRKWALVPIFHRAAWGTSDFSGISKTMAAALGW